MGKYQPFYDLSVTEFAALKDDIALRGVVIPIVVDENGVTIDGHQRRRACAELHIDCPRTVLKGATEDDKMALAIALNAHRRHLSGVERSKAVGRLRALGWSIRDIAETLNIGVATAHRDLAGVPDGTPETVTGKDGKTYSASQPERPPLPVDADGVILSTATSGSDQSVGTATDAAGPGDDETPQVEASSSPAPKVAPKTAEGVAPPDQGPVEDPPSVPPTLVCPTCGGTGEVQAVAS